MLEKKQSHYLVLDDFVTTQYRSLAWVNFCVTFLWMCGFSALISDKLGATEDRAAILGHCAFASFVSASLYGCLRSGLMIWKIMSNSELMPPEAAQSMVAAGIFSVPQAILFESFPLLRSMLLKLVALFTGCFAALLSQVR